MDERGGAVPVDRYRPAPGSLGYLLSSTVLGYLLGLWLAQPWLVPGLVGVPAWVVMARGLRRGRDREAVATMLLWAVSLGITATVIPVMAWDRAEANIIHGAAYRDEMWTWLRTGSGAEGNPREFVPQHLLHLGVFALAAIVSGGLLAIIMGTLLVGYMGFYVASLVHVSPQPWLAGLLGWHPWSLLRVLSYVVLGVVLAAPALRAGAGFRDRRRLLAIAAALLLSDLLLKALLAERWRRLLLHVVT